MFRAKSWLLVGLLSVSCLVPDVEVAGSAGSDDDDGGTPSTSSGGKSNSPTPSAGTGDVANGGSPTATAPVAFGKFCNSVVAGDQNVRMTLEIGTGAKKVSITADSGVCKPISGTACTPIPIGSGIPVSLMFDGEAIVTYPVDFEDGAFWIFLAYTDGENVDVAGDAVTQDVCELGYDAPSGA